MAIAFTLIGRTSGKAAIASSPRITCASASRRVILKKASRASESTETLNRSTPRSHQGLGVALEQIAVGGDRDLAQASDGAQHRDQLRKLPPDQRLPARQPQVADAHRGEKPHQPLGLLEGQDLGSIEPGKPVGGHAVLAAEVAPVDHRKAQIADQPAVSVDEGITWGHWGLPFDARPALDLRAADRLKRFRRDTPATLAPRKLQARTPGRTSSTGMPATCATRGIVSTGTPLTPPARLRDPGPHREYGP